MKKDKGFSLINIVCEGFSLIEILVVISIFAVVGLLSTRAVLLTMRGANKSESQVKVRENINYALSIIERQIRNSESITCPNTSPYKILNYVTSEGAPSFFRCFTGTDTYIASGSARLTSDDIEITTCSIVCTQSDLNNPPVVKISIEAEDANNSSVEKGTVTVETEIVTRNY